jgi:hypothetical protein
MDKHYTIIEWMEFARGFTSEESQERMTRHLAGGCSECQENADFFRKLVNVCRDILPGDVLEKMIEPARDIWPVQPEQAIRIPVKLIHDSQRVSVAAGLRGAREAGWRVLYRAGGDCLLDFQVEPVSRSSRISIVGQILCEYAPQAEMADIPVVLQSGGMMIAETRSNQFGEFQMECEERKQLQLRIYMEHGRRFIEVPVHRFLQEECGEQN